MGETRYFRTGVLQDAWIRHSGVVEAESREEAVAAGYDSWKGRRDDIILVEEHTTGFDHAEALDIEDIEEITKEEYEAELEQNEASKSTETASPAPLEEQELAAALHEASVYGIGATSQHNQQIIVEAAKAFRAQLSPE